MVHELENEFGNRSTMIAPGKSDLLAASRVEK